ncbi:hypothetical protein EDB81DRAFT_763162 [Dactylonectria macrodidyma]|uniref:Uncharacterized protein n=1 Tax=Dactylonectria macrodidyma TaxID=307937 RepID=A0A9P9EA56_9HYPO|nr:hypothetical protein EDB81DRAFT_763162 [Dactylonectria macrodidyma]
MTRMDNVRDVMVAIILSGDMMVVMIRVGQLQLKRCIWLLRYKMLRCEERDPHQLEPALATPCPGSNFENLLRDGAKSLPFYAQKRPGMVLCDPDVAEETIEKLQEAGANENVFVVIAHDAHFERTVQYMKFLLQDLLFAWVSQIFNLASLGMDCIGGLIIHGTLVSARDKFCLGHSPEQNIAIVILEVNYPYWMNWAGFQWGHFEDE